MVLVVQNPPENAGDIRDVGTQETQAPSLGQEDPLEKEMAPHSSVLAWKIPQTEEPGRLQSMGPKSIRCEWAHAYSITSYYTILWGTSLVAQTMKNLPAVQYTWVWSLCWEDPLKKGMATHSSILIWEIARTEEPGKLQSMGLQSRTWLSN